MNPGKSAVGLYLMVMGLVIFTGNRHHAVFAQEPQQQRKPYVFVTLGGPDDGGDFGPKTPGTKTSGIQEALDYAHQHYRDVYIWGGRHGIHDGKAADNPVYNLEQTLHIPWSQDFRLDGGHYILNYSHPTGDAVVIDSQMNCSYKFGLIVAGTSGAGVRIRPTNPGPDDMIVIQASEFEFAAVCSGGTGIAIDATHGPILNSRIFAEETNTQKIAVHLTGTRGITNNSIEVMYSNQYHATDDCTSLKVGDPDSQGITLNRFTMSCHSPAGAYFDQETKRFTSMENFKMPEGAIGLDLYAQSNYFVLSFLGQKRAKGMDIIFQPQSRDNTIFALNLPNGVTNLATVPTNRIVPNFPVGFAVDTPDVPTSGKFLTNRSSYTVEALIINPGAVTDWTLTDATGTAQTITAPLTPGQTFSLEPADQIQFNYTQPPTWRFKALR